MNALQLMWDGFKNGGKWILGFPTNYMEPEKEPRINWTRVIVFLIGFAFLTIWIYPVLSRFIQSLPKKFRR